MTLQVGTRELKNKLSEYLRRVKSGETITVTEHGRVIGHIVPALPTVEERNQRLAAAGLVEWNGQKLVLSPPQVKNRGQRSLSDLIVEERE